MPSEAGLDRYREVVEPMRKWIVVAVAVVLALIAGGSAAGQWRTFLLWRNRQDFGTDDPYFDRDVGFFVFELPWLHYVVNFAMMMTVLGLVAAIVVHYLFGGIRLQSRGDKVSGRRPGAVLGAARPVRAVQGGRLLAGPLRPDHRPGPSVHRRSTTPPSTRCCRRRTS